MCGPGAQQLGSGILTRSLAGATHYGLAPENVLMAILKTFLVVKLITRGDQSICRLGGSPGWSRTSALLSRSLGNAS